MTVRILATKLYPPLPPTSLIQRSALVERLGSGIQGKITLVSAPPGFGKSTLLSAWLATKTGKKVAWFSIDEDDNDPDRFFAYLLATLQPHAPDAVRATGLQLDTLVVQPREIILNLLSSWTNQTDEIVLILDDFHHITTQSVLDSLIYLIDHLPLNLHLVIISRVDPPLPLGRWRVRGQLSEIRANDLRFNTAETAQFLNNVMGLELTNDDIQTLETRTEGWAAGLQLAGLSLQQTTNPSGAIAAFAGSHRYIAEYLTDEVLARQAEDLRQFLLQTSIFERFGAELCDEVLQLSPGTAEKFITTMEHDNLFLVPLNSEASWFRYHHLFTDLLRRRLAQSDPGMVAILHRKAAEVFERHNDLLNAIHHWTRIGETDRVASLIESAVEAHWAQSELSGLMKQMEALPDAVLSSHPGISAFLGMTWLWLGQKVERIGHLLALADQNTADGPSKGRLIVVRSIYTRVVLKNTTEAQLLTSKSLELLAPEDYLWRGFAQLNRAATYYASGEIQKAEKAYDNTIQLCTIAGDWGNALLAMCVKVELIQHRAALKEALAVNLDLLRTIQARGATLMVRGWAHINHARLLYELNDLDGAARESNLAMEYEGLSGYTVDVSMRVFTFIPWLRLAQKDVQGALQAVEKLVDYAEHSGISTAIDQARAIRALLMFRLQEWDAVDAWMTTQSIGSEKSFVSKQTGILLMVRAAVRKRAFADGRLLLSQLTDNDSSVRADLEMIIAIHGALLEQEAGNLNEAVIAIRRALDIAQAGGYIRTFLDEGEPMKRLLSTAQKMWVEGSSRGYIGQILSAFEPLRHDLPDQQALIEPLTGREIEILRLIAEGSSNPEIAEQLFLAVGTVKTHVKNIYGKLGVRDRVSAASKGRALGLLQ